MFRPVKRRLTTPPTVASSSTASMRVGSNGPECYESGGPPSTVRATILSRYRAVNTIVTDETEDFGRVDPDKFNSVINEVENLHELVHRPREQVIDAEALLGITNSLVSCVKAHGNDGLTATDFVTCLLRDFGQPGGPSTSSQGGRVDMDWKNLGVTVSDIFKSCPGCHTMIGPMDTGFKMRKATRRKHVKPSKSYQPEDVGDLAEEKTDTDKNMATMFNILRTKRSVKLENLVLNRNSFAQTVENLFTLSFLVKDGRAEIKVDENGWHLVSPRNAASANAVASGEVVYRHFVFRFDFKDWELMTSDVGVGEELMPNRDQINSPHGCQLEPTSVESEVAGPNTPIRKLSRNRGLVLQEEKIVESSPSKHSCHSEDAEA